VEIKVVRTTFRKIANEAGTPLLLRFGREVARIARGSMTRAEGPSKPNTPPHKHYGDLAKSIEVAVDETTGDVMVGPRASIVGQRGSVLEFAGTYDPTAGRDERGRFLTGHASRKAPSGARWAHPFMRPAFEQAVDAGAFEGDRLNSSFTQ
jgi:hypothetical protein